MMRGYMSEPKLKPCPFCGGEALLNSYESRKGYDAYVECCGCLIQMITVTFDTKEEAEAKAISAWNRRANDEKAD